MSQISDLTSTPQAAFASFDDGEDGEGGEQLEDFGSDAPTADVSQSRQGQKRITYKRTQFMAVVQQIQDESPHGIELLLLVQHCTLLP